MGINEIIFDLDGIILDSEQVWHRVRHDFVVDHGGRWTEEDQKTVMGANSRQWAAYIRENCGVTLPSARIYAGVVDALNRSYRAHLPLFPGAEEAVRALAADVSLGVASSSPPELIELALELAGLRPYFRVLVSSDDVLRGKPEPDVYLEACRRLECVPACAAAIEDSSSGIQAASAAGLLVIAIPNPVFPPPPHIVALADVVLGSVAELRPSVISSLVTEVQHGC